MKCNVPIFFLAAFWVCPGVCSTESSQRLEGQVFIRTEDGATLKLSLTDVCVLDRETAASILARMRQRQSEDLSRFTPAREKAEEAVDRFNKELRPQLVQQERLLKENAEAGDLFIADTREMSQTLYNPGDGPNVTAAKEEHRRYIAKSLAAHESKVKRTQKQIHFSKEDINKGWATGKQLEQALDSNRRAEQKAQKLSNYAPRIADSKALTNTTTDADGKFTVVASTEDVILAVASRTVNGDVETYCWLVSPAAGQPAMLTNRNTVDTSAPENFAVQRQE